MKEENNKEKENVEVKKGNKMVVRLLILFIAGLITANFILSEPKFEITLSIITCLALLVILALSDVFDNLSIPQVISLSKNIKEVKKENEDLKETNLKLTEQIVNISNNIKVVTNVNYNTSGETKIESINNKSEEEEEKENDSPMNIQRFAELEQLTDINDREYINKYRQNAEVVLLKKALSKNISSEILYNVKLTPFVEKITNSPTVFDAMKTEGNKTIFYEVKTKPIMNQGLFYQLYHMLETLDSFNNNYRQCELVLILPIPDKNLDDILGDKSSYSKFKEKIYSRFGIAQEKGLLKIEEIPITKKELDAYIEERENN